MIKKRFDLPIGRMDWLGEHWRTLTIENSDSPQLEMHNLMSHHLVRSMPKEIGWYASVDRDSNENQLIISLEDVRNKREIAVDLSSHPIPVLLPWLDQFYSQDSSVILKLHFILSKGTRGKLLVHQRLDRTQLTKLANGRGVEIRPGPNPQIHPSDNIDVEYIEESSIEEWIQNYDKKGKYGTNSADFSKYKIGTAWNLPQPDGFLDFIFSSHVFEHLANPLGHLVRWKKKLKPDGVILAVVSDMNCTKDYRITPSTLDEILKEYKEGDNFSK